MRMKLAIGLAAGALALGSAVAFAQMNHGMQDGPMPGMGMQQGMHLGVHQQMRERMMQNHAQMQHGPGMQHGPTHGGQPGSHDAASKPKGDAGPSSAAFHAINQKMHDGMDIAYTGNTDVDFVRGMIPHHQGAVDKA